MIAKDRAQGLLIGLLLGDALGAPLQKLKAGHIQQLAGGRVEGFLANPVLQPDKPHRARLAGLHTGLGQAAMAIAAGAEDDGGGQDPLARAAGLLRELAGDQPPIHRFHGALRDPGGPLRRALERWQSEYPWNLEDHFAPAEESEGASLAVAGLACALAKGADPIDAARLTHLKEAPLVAAFVAFEAAGLLAGCGDPKKIDGPEAAAALREAARAKEDELRDSPLGAQWRDLKWGWPVARLSDALEPLANLLRIADDDLAARTLVGQCASFQPARPIVQPQHGFAAAMLPWALYKALGPASPVKLVEDAINAGGESSLAAALVGGLAGARWGADYWPGDWRAALLVDGDALALLAGGAAARDAWIADEAAWTAKEVALQAPLHEKAAKARDAAPPRKKKDPKERISDEDRARGELPFAPPPQVWLRDAGDELAPWERQRLKAERGRKRIAWKEERRHHPGKGGGGAQDDEGA